MANEKEAGHRCSLPPLRSHASPDTLGRVISVTDFLRIVVDPVRLAVLGAAATQVVDPDLLSDGLRVPLKRVQREIGSLVEAGLLTRDLRLDREALVELAKQMPSEPAIDESLLDGRWSEEEAAVLGRFFSGSRLVEIPATRSKRLLVLERLVQEFEPGLRYDEREVNFTLQLFHPDYAALRRYLVDEGLLTRAQGVYWRTGGRV